MKAWSEAFVSYFVDWESSCKDLDKFIDLHIVGCEEMDRIILWPSKWAWSVRIYDMYIIKHCKSNVVYTDKDVP